MRIPRATTACAGVCLVLAVGFGAAGCGGDEVTTVTETTTTPMAVVTVTVTSPSTVTAPTSAEDQITQVLDRYANAVVAGDGETLCDLMTEAGRAQVVAEGRSYGTGCVEIATAGSRMITASLGDDITHQISNIEVDGDRATAQVDFEGSEGDRSESRRLERIDGSWMVGPKLT